jgi:putative ABC transport system ATP-binding protein
MIRQVDPSKATQAKSTAIVQLRALRKDYEEASTTRTVLHTIDADFYEGQFVVLLGKSGSGKSTLLNLIGGIDRPTNGQIIINQTDLTALNERQLTLFRRDHIGFIFQFFNLIPTLTATENVALPFELRGRRGGEGEKRARQLLERVGLSHRANASPDRMSGGEQQRVAIARAIIHEPNIILADEPTGNLDEENGKAVLKLLLALTREVGKTLIMATHNPEIVQYADVVYQVHEGKLTVEHKA